jgi:hypothetical protein
VFRRGVDGRLYSIRPDIVREFVVRDWLTQQIDGRYEPTPAGKRLVNLLLPNEGETKIPNAQQLLKSVAFLEFSEGLQGHPIDLLGPLLRRMSDEITGGTLLHQQRALEYLRNLALARVQETLDLIDIIKTTPRNRVEFKSLLFGKTELTHDKLVADLPWLVFTIAYHVSTEQERLALLRQLSDLFLREFGSTERHWNDGKRAKDLIPRVIRGEANFRSSFWQDGFREAKALLQQVSEKRNATQAELGLIEVVCQPFLTLERERTTFERTMFIHHRWFVGLRSEGDKKRDELRGAVRELLLDMGTSRAVRLAAWRLLENAHGDANRVIIRVKQGQNDTFIGDVRKDLIADLEWTLDLLRKSNLEVWELKAARAMWNWHRGFDSDSTLKELAEKCEQIYQGHPLTAAFHVLFSDEQYKEAEEQAVGIGQKLGSRGNEGAIAEFLSNAEEFGVIDSNWYIIATIGTEVGKHWDDNSEVSKFASTALTRDPQSIPFKFSSAILAEKVSVLRSAGNDEDFKRFLDEWLAIPREPSNRSELLCLLYWRPHPLVTGILRKPDFEILLSALGVAPASGIGGSIVPVDKLRPNTVRKLTEKAT